jgi:hypothetical protein
LFEIVIVTSPRHARLPRSVPHFGLTYNAANQARCTERKWDRARIS